MKPSEIRDIQSELTQWLEYFTSTSEQTVRMISQEPHDYSDIVDRASALSDMDYALNRLCRKGLNKGNILNALRKIENGSYGICEECEEEIPIQRLKAVPDARYCISCQTEMEKVTV